MQHIFFKQRIRRCLKGPWASSSTGSLALLQFFSWLSEFIECLEQFMWLSIFLEWELNSDRHNSIKLICSIHHRCGTFSEEWATLPFHQGGGGNTITSNGGRYTGGSAACWSDASIALSGTFFQAKACLFTMGLASNGTLYSKTGVRLSTRSRGPSTSLAFENKFISRNIFIGLISRV